MKRLVVLSGAGISAESGLKTFRDSDGLWEGYNVEDVATPDAWKRDPELVQRFYNERRKAVQEAQPNAAHLALVELEQFFDVRIITQNIDNLHERAGSRSVLHLHGLITQARSSRDPNLVYEIDGWELKMGEYCELGSQLRPHIVWFGEAVPMIQEASVIAQGADIMLVIGTSLAVYPAANLVHYCSTQIPIFVIDPKYTPGMLSGQNVRGICKTATQGVRELMQQIIPLAGV